MKKFEKKIIDELNNFVPDIKDRIRASIVVLPVPHRKVKWQMVAVPIVALILLVVVVATPLALVMGRGGENGGGGVVPATTFNLAISVNPSVEFIFDVNDNVISQKGLNKDGVKVLYKENFVGMNINDVTEHFLTLLEKYGYLDGNDVRIILKDNNGMVNIKKANEVKRSMESQLDALGISSKSLLNMTEKELELLEKELEENGDDYYQDIKKTYFEEVKTVLSDKISNIEKLITICEPEAKKDDESLVSENVKKAIKDFLKVYTIEMDLNINGKLTKDDIYELIEELEEEKQDLQEILEDINEDNDDDFDDIIEDIIEIVKERINKK